MTTTKNPKNLRQYYKGIISLIVKQILAFDSSTNIVREVKKVSSNFKRIA